MTIRHLSFALLTTLLLHITVTNPPALAAEHDLSVNQAVSEAEEKSPDLHRAEALAGAASWRKLEALSKNIPHFGISLNHLFDAKFQMFPPPLPFTLIQPLNTINLDATWTVFDGLETPAAFFAAKANSDAAELELSRARLEVESDVTVKFYQALAAQKLAAVAAQNVKTLEDHLQQTKNLLSGGEVTRYDLLRVQTQLEEAYPDKITADDNVILSRAMLATAMGQENDGRVLIGDLPIPDDAIIQKVGSLKITYREDVAALKRRADAASDSHFASQSWYLPAVQLFAQRTFYTYTDSSVFSDSYQMAYTLGFRLSWNIFDGGAAIARQKEASYNQLASEASAQAATLRAPNEFETYKRKFTSNVALYRARKRAIDSAEESVRLAKVGFGAGTRTTTDLLDSELDLFRARAGVVRAQVDAAQALINFQLALGRKI